MVMTYFEKYRDGRHKNWKDLWIIKPFIICMKVLFRTTIHRPVTVLYPYEKLWEPDNYRGRPGLDFNKCIGCGMCARMCPCAAIILVETPDDEGQPVMRPQVNMGRCSFCAYCAEYCPVDAMTVTPIVELAEFTRSDLIYGPRRLAYAGTTEGMKVPLKETLISDYKAGNKVMRDHASIDRPELEGAKCISCKKCSKVCPVNAITMVEHGVNAKGRPILWPEINSETCVSCSNCIDACPKSALSMKEVL
ncbi:Formate hydrogenlyase subunit 6/NADH:ubiquinone oxidoreductase 23 kD subunit (chain I) [Thermoplasmatales archaeon BRNA1]|nr:Formate hydrogenlyase subunit 6/NADH:ubiquinone oxidoreductase 23 kD subunit (chain I) [Thermoplasmatales archaeon BRNA1]